MRYDTRMPRSALVKLTCLISILASRMSFGSVLADSSTGFSGAQGAQNWYYGYFPNGNVDAFTQLPVYNAQAGYWQHTTFGPPWTMVGANSAMHPNGANSGIVEWAAREWVSNYEGQIIVRGHLAKAAFAAVPTSSGVYGRIYCDHQLVYEQFIEGTDSAGVNYSLNLIVKPGDLLDFAVAPNGMDTSDTTLFSASISTEYDVVSVDFATLVTVKPALGFLHGFDLSNPFSSNSPSPAALISPLQPQYWRTAPSLPAFQFIRSFAPAIPIDIVLSDGVGYPPSNYDGNGPPWQDWSAYQGALQELLAGFVPPASDLIFEPWNEPDDGWAAWAVGGTAYKQFWNGTAEQFYQTYLIAFQTIRAVLGPNSQVAGPSFASYDHRGMQDFLEFCLANGCEVNSLTWHELNDSVCATALPGDVQDARTSFLENPRYAPLKIERIDVNEIVGPGFTPQPAGTLAYYNALEISGADGAAHSCWLDSTGASGCVPPGALDGLLTDATFQPRAVWWLHKAYADGVSGRVQSVASNPSLVILASNSITSANTPQILVGNFNYQNTLSSTPNPLNVNLALTNLQAMPEFGQDPLINVRVELIPDTGEAAVNELKLVAEINAPVIAGAAQVDLPPLQVGEVFRVTLIRLAHRRPPGIPEPHPKHHGAAPTAF